MVTYFYLEFNQLWQNPTGKFTKHIPDHLGVFVDLTGYADVSDGDNALQDSYEKIKVQR